MIVTKPLPVKVTEKSGFVWKKKSSIEPYAVTVPVMEEFVKLSEPPKKLDVTPLNVTLVLPMLSVTLFIAKEDEPPEMSPV